MPQKLRNTNLQNRNFLGAVTSPIALSLISGLFISVLSIAEPISAQSSCSDKEISDRHNSDIALVHRSPQ